MSSLVAGFGVAGVLVAGFGDVCGCSCVMAGMRAARGVLRGERLVVAGCALGRVVVAAESAERVSEEVRSCVGSARVSAEVGDGPMRCGRR